MANIKGRVADVQLDGDDDGGKQKRKNFDKRRRSIVDVRKQRAQTWRPQTASANLALIRRVPVVAAAAYFRVRARARALARARLCLRLSSWRWRRRRITTRLRAALAVARLAAAHRAHLSARRSRPPPHALSCAPNQIKLALPSRLFQTRKLFGARARLSSGDVEHTRFAWIAARGGYKQSIARNIVN